VLPSRLHRGRLRAAPTAEPRASGVPALSTSRAAYFWIGRLPTATHVLRRTDLGTAAAVAAGGIDGDAHTRLTPCSASTKSK
jgi:hypothetical protein